MFCNNCGKKIDNNSSFCSHCGNSLNNNDEIKQVVYVKKSNPGNGISTAGMVLGIIAISFAILYLLALTTNDFKADMIIYRGQVAAYAFGVILIPTALSATGLPLSLCGMAKNKSGKNISGIILNSITLVMQIFVFIYIVSTYS